MGHRPTNIYKFLFVAHSPHGHPSKITDTEAYTLTLSLARSLSFHFILTTRIRRVHLFLTPTLSLVYRILSLSDSLFSPTRSLSLTLSRSLPPFHTYSCVCTTITYLRLFFPPFSISVFLSPAPFLPPPPTTHYFSRQLFVSPTGAGELYPADGDLPTTDEIHLPRRLPARSAFVRTANQLSRQGHYDDDDGIIIAIL